MTAVAEVTAAPNAQPEGLPAVQHAFDALRGESEQFERFAVSLVDELETMRRRMVDRERAMEQRWQGLDERERELQAADAELVARRRALEARQQQLDAAGDEVVAYQQQVAAAHSQRDEALVQLADARRELSQLETSNTQLADVANELVQARDEISQLQQQLAERPSQATDSTPITGEDKADQLHAELEQELEQVRRRAAELGDKVADLEEEARRRNADHTAELDELRRAAQVQQRAAAVAAAPSPEHVGATQHPLPAQGKADSVVGSVMEQFSRLQSEAAQRRAAQR